MFLLLLCFLLSFVADLDRFILQLKTCKNVIIVIVVSLIITCMYVWRMPFAYGSASHED
jgi:hypothetical protein